jgi:hypothetical protein
MAVAELVVNVVGIYAAIGVVFGIAFVMVGIGRVDPVAKDSTLGFRLIVLPGAALLWPLLLRRWFGARHP